MGVFDRLFSNGDDPDEDGDQTEDYGEKAKLRGISIDDLCHTLRVERRRKTIKMVANAEGSVTLREVSKRVAAIENGVPQGQATSDQRKATYVALYQNHVPQLVDVGLVRMSEDNELYPTPKTDGAAELVEEFETLTGEAER